MFLIALKSKYMLCVKKADIFVMWVLCNACLCKPCGNLFVCIFMKGDIKFAIKCCKIFATRKNWGYNALEQLIQIM